MDQRMLSKFSSLNKVHKNKSRSHIRNDFSARYKQSYSGLLWDTSSKATQDLFEDTGVGMLPDWDSREEVTDFHFKSTEERLSAITIDPDPEVRMSCDQSPDREIEEPSPKLFGEDLILFRRRQDQTERSDQTKKVSDEILLAIFKMLPRKTLARCSNVCKRWRNIASDESLWKRVDLRKRFLKTGQLGHVINKNVTVLRLNRAKIETPVFDPLCEQDTSFSSLQYLDLSMAYISKEGIVEILSVCCQLKNLSLESCCLNDEVFLHISKNQELKVLNLALCQEINKSNLLTLNSHCRKIISLNLAWINLMSCDYEDFFRTLNPGLKELNLSGTKSHLTHKGITTLANQCPNLVELDLSDAHHLGSESIELIISRLPLLQRLHLSYCYNLPIESYLALSRLRYLKTLSARGLFTEEALQMLRDNLSNVLINGQAISTIARPSSFSKDLSIWGIPLT